MDNIGIAKKAVSNLRQAAFYRSQVKRGFLSQEDCDLLIAEGKRSIAELRAQLELPLEGGSKVKASK